MIDLTHKMAFFREMIYGHKLRKSSIEINKSLDESQKRIEKRKEELEQSSKHSIQRRLQIVSLRENESIQTAKEDSRKAILKAEVDCLDDLMKVLEDKLYKYAETEEYFLQIKNDIEKEVQLHDISKNSELYLCTRDIQRLKNSNFDLSKFLVKELLDSEIGGFMLFNSALNYRVNYTLRNKLESISYEVGKKLHEALR